ncbi:MAG: DUF1236 domain-containing protein, partial [Pseudomonadota bacterium]
MKRNRNSAIVALSSAMLISVSSIALAQSSGQPAAEAQPGGSAPKKVLPKGGEAGSKRAPERRERQADRAEQRQERASERRERKLDQAEKKADQSADKAERAKAKAERTEERAQKKSEAAEKRAERKAKQAEQKSEQKAERAEDKAERKAKRTEQAEERKERRKEQRAEERKDRQEDRAERRDARDERNAERADDRKYDAKAKQQAERERDEQKPKQADAAADEKPDDKERARAERVRNADLRGERRKRFLDRISEHRKERKARRYDRRPNITISIGSAIPSAWDYYELPPRIVEIEPAYRDYHYVIVEDDYVIVEPRTRKIVKVIRASGGDDAFRVTKRMRRDILDVVGRSGLSISIGNLSIDVGKEVPDRHRRRQFPSELVDTYPGLDDHRPESASTTSTSPRVATYR